MHFFFVVVVFLFVRFFLLISHIFAIVLFLLGRRYFTITEYHRHRELYVFWAMQHAAFVVLLRQLRTINNFVHVLVLILVVVCRVDTLREIFREIR